jgi:hypothetical protein
MRAPLTLPAHSEDFEVPIGREGREGRDFQSPLEQPPPRNIYIHERRPRAYTREGENNADIFSRPSRPTRPGDAIAGRRSSDPIGFAAEGPPVSVLFASANKPPGGRVTRITDARMGIVGRCTNGVCMEFTPADELREGKS